MKRDISGRILMRPDFDFLLYVLKNFNFMSRARIAYYLVPRGIFDLKSYILPLQYKKHIMISLIITSANVLSLRKRYFLFCGRSARTAGGICGRCHAGGPEGLRVLLNDKCNVFFIFRYGVFSGVFRLLSSSTPTVVIV